jgi:flagellar basal-body rod modification protein FlgD
MTMAIDSLGATASGADTLAQTVNQNDLFKILLTQLKYQDPLKPTDNAEFIAQLAQFTSLDQARQTNENIQALLQMQSANQSVGLIGKTVEVISSTGNKVGQVTTISFNQGTPLLTIKMADTTELTNISLSQVQLIR